MSMKIDTSFPRLKGYRFPREVIAYAVCAYYCFTISAEDVEDLLAELGVIVSCETVRLWVNKFASHFANCIRRDRSQPKDKCHLAVIAIIIRAKKHWL